MAPTGKSCQQINDSVSYKSSVLDSLEITCNKICTMTTIIRVKRHRQNDPVEAVLLECKRRKTEDDENPHSFEKVLSFSGTLDKKDDLTAQTLAASFSDGEKAFKDIKKSHKPDLIAKNRQEKKVRREESRFKIVSCLRSTFDNEDVHSTNDDISNNLAIVDVSLENAETSSEDVFNTEDSYVYDIYTGKIRNEEFNEIFLDNDLGIEPYSYEDVFDFQYRNPTNFAEEDFDPDEDDSNDENNWRNDYPDSDLGSDEDDKNLAEQFKACRLGEGYELSSDEGEENYIYDYSGDNFPFDRAAEIGGSRYSRYKSKVIEELYSTEIVDDEDEEESF